jgi:hypothetical protein
MWPQGKGYPQNVGSHEELTTDFPCLCVENLRPELPLTSGALSRLACHRSETTLFGRLFGVAADCRAAQGRPYRAHTRIRMPAILIPNWRSKPSAVAPVDDIVKKLIRGPIPYSGAKIPCSAKIIPCSVKKIPCSIC